MQKTAVVTGADRGLGLALTSRLLAKGWRVFAGQFMSDWPELSELPDKELLTIVPLDVASLSSVQDAVQLIGEQTDHVDLVINNAGINALSRTQTIRDGQDYDETHRLYDVNALGPLRVVETFLPLIEKSEMKRLCFVSSEAGSIERAKRDAWFPYCMSKAALNMGVRILYNDLRKDGFTFRLYHPGGIKSYIGGTGVKGTKGRLEPEEAADLALDYFLSHCDEDRLVMRDWKGQDWPW